MVSRVARNFEVSSDSLYRHIPKCMAPQLRDALKGDFDFSTKDLVLRVSANADRARQIASASMLSGNLTQALRAGDAETRQLMALAERFDIDSTDVAFQIERADSIIGAMIGVAQRDPAIARLIAGELERRDAPELATSIRTLADHHTKKEISE